MPFIAIARLFDLLLCAVHFPDLAMENLIFCRKDTYCFYGQPIYLLRFASNANIRPMMTASTWGVIER
jgi:hypothetical protein